jgi:anthranilate synthase component 1
MIFPSLEEAKTLAEQGNVIPVCKSVLADTETPVSVWLKLFRNESYSFLLESVEGRDTVARYSFLGGAPFLTFSCRGTSWKVGGTSPASAAGDPVGALRKLFSAYRSVAVSGVPRFCGGAVGYFSYDAIRLSERVPDKNPKDDPADDIFFAFYRDVIAFDNREHRLLLITNIILDNGASIEGAYKDALHRLGAMEDRMAVRLQATHLSVRQQSDAVSNFSKEAFKAAVEKCREYIRAGDIFQVVPSQRFTVRVEADPFDLYRTLRVVNPSPYMYYLAVDGTSIIGASPEMLVRVENGQLEMRPIAGTRPRGKTEAEDDRLVRELLADPKERAEHIMLVDLGRNDVGRVARTGTVHVEEMMHIERY